jgi:hypothetical protein
MKVFVRHTGVGRYPVSVINTKSWIVTPFLNVWSINLRLKLLCLLHFPAFAGMTIITHLNTKFQTQCKNIFTKMMSKKTVLNFGLMAFFAAASIFSQELGKRSEFTIPLIQMSLGEDESGGPIKKVRIAIDETKEYAVITNMNDTHVKNTRNGVEKIQYQESPDRAFIISDFEAKQLRRVVNSFIETLSIFEKDLNKHQWGRCLYLDAFFPRFLKRFNNLVCAARNSNHAMPRFSSINETEYEISLNSPLSDKRIKMWQTEKDHIVKLRILSKELSYQLARWDEKELTGEKRNTEIAYSAKAEEAYGLFVRMYFNLRPAPEVPSDGEHL